MNPRRTHKKNLIVSYKTLSDELKDLLKERYPDGYKDYIQRFEKPNGDTIFVVPLETDDSVYMIKFDVKIDTTFSDDDIEKDYFDEEVSKAEEDFAPLQEAIDKEEEDTSHTERVVRHGDYEEDLDSKKKHSKKHGSLSALGEELQEAFGDDAENPDDYDEEDYDEEDKDEEDADPDEPTDEELMDIDSEIYAMAEVPPEELARMAASEPAAPAPRKKGRPRKNPLPEVPAAPKKKGRPRKNPQN